MSKKTNQTIVGLKDLRENMEKYIRQVESGKTLTIVRRSSPVFRLAPIADDESLWEDVIDFTKIKKGGISIDEVLSRL